MSKDHLTEENLLFLNEFYSLVNAFDNKKEMERKANIKLNYLIRIAEFLVIANPQSQTKKHKENLLNYLKALQNTLNDNEYSKSKYIGLKHTKLYPITQWMRKYGFRSSYELINFKIYIGLVFDLIFWVLLLKEHFYFVPIFTLLFVLNGFWNLMKVKREKKLLNL
ncbi:hypothetical protein [Mangrovimonas xylaniphaga]|uniref:hypothetical protein n=1 Tax=Mangrovimonas xylaniphaga TaxID=1645915 RepID=UPI0006B63479|nr:hypothetical protein [Mangrovimonas xylaniphaga]